jgi:hypothetical protein
VAVWVDCPAILCLGNVICSVRINTWESENLSRFLIQRVRGIQAKLGAQIREMTIVLLDASSLRCAVGDVFCHACDCLSGKF